MQIILYKNTRPSRNIARTLSDPLTLTGEPRSADTLDMYNPEIVIPYNSTIFSGYNFCYIPEYGRYYFINDFRIIGKTILLSMHVDVLYTYRDSVLNSQCIAERSSSNYELMLEDTAVSAVAGYDIFSRSLPYTFRPDQGIYVLIVAGG